MVKFFFPLSTLHFIWGIKSCIFKDHLRVREDRREILTESDRERRWSTDYSCIAFNPPNITRTMWRASECHEEKHSTEWTTSFHFQEILFFYSSKMLWCYSSILSSLFGLMLQDEMNYCSIRYPLGRQPARKRRELNFLKLFIKKNKWCQWVREGWQKRKLERLSMGSAHEIIKSLFEIFTEKKQQHERPRPRIMVFSCFMAHWA